MEINNLKAILEGMNLSDENVDRVIKLISFEKSEKKQDTSITDSLDDLIAKENDPYKKASLVARKISNKLDRYEY